MKRYIFVHGHFYQPPRENPWLDHIELQESARPYDNWNERITAECYAPNVASRILDDEGNIGDIVNNYAKMSFNFGPTLLSWLQRFQPEVYLAILKADKSSQQVFGGHGSAIAQAYNHMIMPLANERDKRTQVIWGIKDFESRFKRLPEGMWLPETAVDVATLETLAAFGIKFTILAPSQAKRIRRINEKTWKDVAKASFDIQRPYSCPLPSGKRITIFFYDGPISHDLAFAGLLNSGVAFAQRLTDAFLPDEQDRCVCCATDGETFGHHHRFGNMALAYCLYFIDAKKLAALAVPGLILEKMPAQDEVQINDNSSWSCAHGVERWRADCGCHVGGHKGWNQKWRAPLREAMDWLRDEMMPLYDAQISMLVRDPWGVRDAYIEVILDRSPDRVEAFLRCHAKKDLTDQEKVLVLKLLEMQRHAMLMYTSCGWFFDDMAGIESVQILQYAARAIQLVREAYGTDLEPGFLEILARAPGNVRKYKNGAEIYEKLVKPQVIGLLHVGAHFAISSLFEEYSRSADVYAYTVQTEGYETFKGKGQKLAVGRARIRSKMTWEEQDIEFCVLLFGDYNLHGSVQKFSNARDFANMKSQMKKVFLRNKSGQVIRQMDQHFGGHSYSLWDLFKNEQARVLGIISRNTLESVEKHFREIYRHYYPLMQIKPEFHIPIPKAMAMSVEFVLHCDLVDLLQKETIDIDKMKELVFEIKRWPFMRHNQLTAYEANKKIDAMMHDLARHPKQNARLIELGTLLELLEELSLDLDLWKSQNIYFSMARTLKPIINRRAQSGDDNAREWIEHFERLGQQLKVKIKTLSDPKEA